MQNGFKVLILNFNPWTRSRSTGYALTLLPLFTMKQKDQRTWFSSQETREIIDDRKGHAACCTILRLDSLWVRNAFKFNFVSFSKSSIDWQPECESGVAGSDGNCLAHCHSVSNFDDADDGRNFPFHLSRRPEWNDRNSSFSENWSDALFPKAEADEKGSEKRGDDDRRKRSQFIPATFRSKNEIAKSDMRLSVRVREKETGDESTAKMDPSSENGKRRQKRRVTTGSSIKVMMVMMWSAKRRMSDDVSETGIEINLQLKYRLTAGSSVMADGSWDTDTTAAAHQAKRSTDCWQIRHHIFGGEIV